MNRVYNFSSGPACMPDAVLEQAAAEMTNWHGIGYSPMSMSHRGAAFMSILNRAERDLRDLMKIPDNYTVMFLPSSTSQQFSAVPLNLMVCSGKSDHIITGEWSKKAFDEASRYGNAQVAFSTENTKFTTLPDTFDLYFNQDADYVHYCPNETIRGVEFDWVPETGAIPLVADASSMILSRPMDVSRYGLIYAGAQKNISLAGLTLIIVRNNLLKDPQPMTPTLLNYKSMAKNEGLYNTPPTYGIYIAGLVFDWLKKQGGVEEMAKVNQRKSEKLYDYLDQSKLYHNKVAKPARSRMNVTFFLKRPELEDMFVEEAEKVGLIQLRGHRSVGGLRASLYNAMPEEGVDALIRFMEQFEKDHAE